MSRTVLRPYRKAAELNLGGTSSSEKVFIDADSNAVICALPPGILGPSTTVGRQFAWFLVRYGGRVTGGTTTTFAAQLQWGSSTTPTSNTDIESGPSAVAVNSNAGIFGGVAEVLIAVTGTGTARIEAFSNQATFGSTRTYTAVAVSDNSITTYDATSLTVTGFLVTGTFGTGNAGNLAYLDMFTVEVVE